MEVDAELDVMAEGLADLGDAGHGFVHLAGAVDDADTTRSPFDVAPFYDALSVVDWPDGAPQPVRLSRPQSVRPRMLRRLIETGRDLRGVTAREVMHAGPKMIRPDALAVEAADLMELHRITSVIVVDENGELVGALNSNDLMRAKVI